MGKSYNNAVAEQEITKLRAQLYQSAHDATTYLEALKHGLAVYDRVHHLHHSKSVSCFFSDGLDHAKEAVKALKHVADHMHKDARTIESTSVCRAMEQAFNTLADLHKVADAYDTEFPPPGKKLPTSETVEWLVSTTRDAKFTGFAPLQKQIVEVQLATHEIEKPSITTLAKEVMHNAVSKIEDKILGDDRQDKCTKTT
ncbi:unnamed protein product [Hyaloperonospora brassicae]|uniref:Uncharacterized protein n=1 Tax=Hyaloperonospora brassicae TaxID=162125 RepID=A0AAV0UK67_HYABA|nr:unnamed protein product [Hyaloperonospora brassicae]